MKSIEVPKFRKVLPITAQVIKSCGRKSSIFRKIQSCTQLIYIGSIFYYMITKIDGVFNKSCDTRIFLLYIFFSCICKYQFSTRHQLHLACKTISFSHFAWCSFVLLILLCSYQTLFYFANSLLDIQANLCLKKEVFSI